MGNKQCLTDSDLVVLLKKKQGEKNSTEFAREIGITPMQLSDVYSGRRAVRNERLLQFLKLQREDHFYKRGTPCMYMHGVVELLRQAKGSKLQKDFARAIGVPQSVLSEVCNGRRDPNDTILEFLKVKHIVHFVPAK
jgi:transcriptional regulator with XRE-family HTH domain